MYESFYQLDGKPFRLTPDAGMLFPSKGHKRAMSYLLYGLEQGEGFVMITGAVGTGKTLLIRKLFDALSRRDIAIASMASANLDGEDILPAVASEFDIPFEGRSKESLLQDVRNHLAAVNARHTHALLVVDEAQTLTPKALEMLRILSNFEQDGHALLQVFLVGQSELRLIMVNNHLEQLRQRIVASYRLEPMEPEESQAYILHRLHAVGWADDPVLEPELFAAVYRASRGIPRKINLIMDRLLLYGYLEELHCLGTGALQTVLDEMSDEMAGVPQTLEPATTHDADIRDQPVSEGRDDKIASLERRYNRLLLRVIRHEIQIEQLLHADTDAAPARPSEENSSGSVQPIRPARKRE